MKIIFFLHVKIMEMTDIYANSVEKTESGSSGKFKLKKMF